MQRIVAALVTLSMLLAAALVPASDGTITLDARDVRIIVGSEHAELADLVASGIEQRTGIAIPIHGSGTVSAQDWDRFHFLAIGRFSNNPVIERLYHEIFTFVDGSFPGEGGVHVKTIVNPYRNDRHIVVIGGSDAQGTRDSVEAFLKMLPESGDLLPPLHLIQSDQLPSNAPNPERRAELIEENKQTYIESRGSVALNRASIYALRFYFTNDEGWAELFRDTIMHFIDQAHAHGDWFWAPRLALHFRIGTMIETWKLIEDDPFFTSEERDKITQAFHDMSVEYLLRYDKFTTWANPDGEPRQNHTTFAATSLDATARYFGRRGVDVSSWEAEAERIFAGQLRTYRADDEAGHYSFYAPTHTFAYYVKRDMDRLRESGIVHDLADLAVITMDNLRNEVSWGDVRTFVPFESMAYQRYGGIPVGLSAWLHDDPDHLWAFHWMNEGKEIPVGTQGNANTLSYYLHPDPSIPPPARFLSMTTLLMDDAPIEWIAARVRNQRWMPVSGRQYFDKISLRPSFDEMDEYLLLGGVSALSHGHEDGNAVLRLTWKDRIWLEDLDYIRPLPRYNNSIEVIRNGGTDIVPPLAELTHQLETADTVLFQSRLEKYTDTNWDRNVVWSQGRYFLVIDRMEALLNADYDFRRHWRILGDVELGNNRLRATQAGAEFRIVSGDESIKTMVREQPGQSDWSRYPHADPEVKVYQQRLSGSRAAGESVLFADLIFAVEQDDEHRFDLRRSGVSGWVIFDDSEPTAAAGLAREGRNIGDLYIESEIYSLHGIGLLLSGATVMDSPSGSVSASGPVSIAILAGVGAHIEAPAGTILHASAGLSLQAMESGKDGVDRYALDGFEAGTLKDALSTEARRSRQVMAGRDEKPVAFGMKRIDHADLGNEPTFIDVALGGDNGNAHWAIGLASGEALWMTSRLERIASLNVEHEVRSITEHGDLTIIGDEDAGINAFRGQELAWHVQLFENRGRREKIVALGVIDTPRGERLIIATEGARVHSYTLEGEMEWMEAFKYHSATSMTFGDVDGDGRAEIIIGNEYHTPVNVYKDDGQVLWLAWEQVGSEFDSTTEFLGTHAHALSVAALQEDQTPGIILGNGSDEVIHVDAADGTVRWRANVGGEALHAMPLGDGQVLAGSSTGYLHLIASNGEIVWTRKTAGRINAMDVMLHQEIDTMLAVVGTEEGEVVVYDTQGNVLARSYDDGPIIHAAFDSDESNGIVTATLSGIICRWEFQLPRSAFGPHYRTDRHRY